MSVTRSAAFWNGMSAIRLAGTGAFAARKAERPSRGLVRSSSAALRAEPFSTSTRPGFSRSRR